MSVKYWRGPYQHTLVILSGPIHIPSFIRPSHPYAPWPYRKSAIRDLPFQVCLPGSMTGPRRANIAQSPNATSASTRREEVYPPPEVKILGV